MLMMQPLVEIVMTWFLKKNEVSTILHSMVELPRLMSLCYNLLYWICLPINKQSANWIQPCVTCGIHNYSCLLISILDYVIWIFSCITCHFTTVAKENIMFMLLLCVVGSSASNITWCWKTWSLTNLNSSSCPKTCYCHIVIYHLWQYEPLTGW